MRSLLIENPRLTLHAIAEQLNITKDTISTIIRKDLNRRKICARFVPRSLTPVQKEALVNCCRDFVETANSDPNFLNIVAMKHDASHRDLQTNLFSKM